VWQNWGKERHEWQAVAAVTRSGRVFKAEWRPASAYGCQTRALTANRRREYRNRPGIVGDQEGRGWKASGIADGCRHAVAAWRG
jgi:hypothetical protein